MRRVYKKNRQERTSKLQHTVFLDFLEDNPDFDPRQHLAKRFMPKWRNVVLSLNKVGPSRNVDTWVYILHSWRNQIKSKAKKIALDPLSGLILSTTEKRALEIFQRDGNITSGSPSCNSSLNLDHEGIAGMLDVQIKQEVGSINGEDESSDVTENLPDDNDYENNLEMEVNQNCSIQLVPVEKKTPIETPSIRVRPTERLLRPSRMIQIPSVPLNPPTRSQTVKISRVHAIPPTLQEPPAPVICPAPTPILGRNDALPANALLGLAQSIQQSVDKWVETNRTYNRHRMEMDRQNAASLSVIASSLNTFSQAVLNFSQQEGSNNLF